MRCVSRQAIHGFYSAVENVQRECELVTLRVAGNEAAFHFKLTVSAGDSRMVIEPIDVMVFDADGKVERIVTVALDIGERKRGELEMRKAKDAAEAALRGKTASRDAFREAAEIALRDARPQSDNGFKIELAKRCLTQALLEVTA